MRKAWIDYLRVIALGAVIMGHIAADFYHKYGEVSPADWWLTNILNASLRFAVPIYVMASGALLLDRSWSTVEFYKKRAVRLIPPLLFWNLLYLGIYIYQGMDLKTVLWNFKALIIVNGFVAPHLWYISMFICLMLFVPFINMFVRGEKPTAGDLGILLGITFPFFVLNTIASFAYHVYDLQMEWFKLFPWYMVYFLAGYYLDRYSDEIPIRNGVIAASILIIVLINATLGYYSVSSLGIKKDAFLVSELGGSVFLLSMLVFLLAKRLSHFLKENKLITAIAQASFGMYLIHEIFNGMFYNFAPDYFSHGLIYIPGLALLTFILSFVSITLLRKIPVMRALC
ncbi:MAG: acyltransferase family protein [Anaerolineales bacterium]